MSKKPPPPLSAGDHTAGAVLFLALVAALIFIAVQTSKLTAAEEQLQASEWMAFQLGEDNYDMRRAMAMREEHPDRPPVFLIGL
jgi:hypothetical protein